MSRVQCLECGMAVVVDPTGVCPEGHLVGRAGVRVAGAMGSDVLHPDEPEPWVATVVLDEVDPSPAARERTIRPLQVAGADAATEAERGEAADHESVLRELHALGDVREATPPPGVPETVIAPVPEAPPVAHVPPPPQEQVAEGFAELSALEAAFQALGYSEYAAVGGDQTHGHATDATPAPPPPAAHPDPVMHAGDEAGTGDDLAHAEGRFPSPSATDRADDRASTEPGPGPSTTATPRPPEPPASPSSTTSTPPPAPTAAPAPAPVPTPAPAPAPTMPSAPDADEAPRAKEPGLDFTNFTARGGKVGSGRGGRRRLFGR